MQSCNSPFIPYICHYEITPSQPKESIMKKTAVLMIMLLIVTGCATDFCVDTTIRSANSRDYQVVVAADGHTTADRPHVDAGSLIQHHNWLWQNLIHPKLRIDVVQTDDLIAYCNTGDGWDTCTSPIL